MPRLHLVADVINHCEELMIAMRRMSEIASAWRMFSSKY